MKIKKFTSRLLLSVSVLLLAFSTEAAVLDAESEAKRYHELATSDIVYTDEELKALYYQNKTIIELLRDIKKLLGQQLIQLKEKKSE